MAGQLADYPDPRQESFSHLQKTYDLNDTAGQLQGLEDDGYALIPGVLTPEEVQETKAEIDRLRAFGFDANTIGKLSHYKCIFNRSPFWLKYLDYPGIIDLAEASMGNDSHIIGMTAWRSWPGWGGFRYHSDHLFIEMDEELLVSGQVKPPIMLCTAHFYLNDITIDLCPTWVIPGSHRSGRWAQNEPEDARDSWRGVEAQPVLVKAGDVLFFRSEVWHSGSKNTSEDTRYLLQVHYSNRFVAQKFSPYLDFRFNQEVVSQATDRQLRLLGKHKQSSYD